MSPTLEQTLSDVHHNLAIYRDLITTLSATLRVNPAKTRIMSKNIDDLRDRVHDEMLMAQLQANRVS